MLHSLLVNPACSQKVLHLLHNMPIIASAGAYLPTDRLSPAETPVCPLHQQFSFFNHRSGLVAAAQLNLLCPSCSSSTGQIGRTPS
jgi:hypothetical protein